MLYSSHKGISVGVTGSYICRREKHKVIRNDFLDSMMELRNRGKRSVKEGKTSRDGRNEGSNFGKITHLQTNFLSSVLLRLLILWMFTNVSEVILQRRNNSDDRTRHTHRCENLKSELQTFYVMANAK